MRLMAIHLDGTGTAALSQGSTQATLTDNGTGDYTLTFAQPLGRAPIVVASPLTADVIVQISAASASACTIKSFDATDGTTAKDADLHILIMGAEVADENA
jgi:hypothetical protein